MQKIEQWKPVPDFEGIYEISDKCRLRRISTHKGRAKESYPSPHLKKSGYVDYWLWKDGKPTRRIAHRLMWEAFNGPIAPGLVMNHKNGIRDDNRIENLEIVTQSENVRDGFLRGRKPPNNPSHGEANGGAKLREHEVREIRRLRASGSSQREVSEKFGISIHLVSLIHRRRIWKHLSD